MNRFAPIRNYFGLKGSTTKYSLFWLIFTLLIWNCAGTAYQQMAEENPKALLAKKDSLQAAGNTSTAFNKAFAKAHNYVGLEAMKSKNYSFAIQNFKDATALVSEDTLSQYNLLLAQGNQLLKKGKKEGLWDAIQKFHKAGRLFPDLGEPHYYIGYAYLMIGNKDFDLILESYNKALSLTLSPELNNVVLVAKEKAQHREKTLKYFWK